MDCILAEGREQLGESTSRDTELGEDGVSVAEDEAGLTRLRMRGSKIHRKNGSAQPSLPRPFEPSPLDVKLLPLTSRSSAPPQCGSVQLE